MNNDEGRYNMKHYEGNSNKAKDAAAKQDEKAPVKKVVKGSVKTKKKSEFKKIAGSIVSEEVSSIKEHAIYSIIIPVIQDTLSQLLKDSVDLLFHGEVRGSSRSSRNGGRSASKVSYRDYYDDRGRGDSSRRREPQRHERYSYDDLIFDSRTDAEDVLNRMDEILEQYGVVTVADLFDLADVTGNGYPDQNYGWTNLRSASVERNRHNEYTLKMPRATSIR